MFALLTPPGATHDEWYHLGSIWCGHGERSNYCEEKGETPDYGMSANVNLPVINCKAEPNEILHCPIDFDGQSQPLINDGLYPPSFYWILSWLVVPSAQASIVLVRLASAFLISLLLGFSLWLLPLRFQTTLILVVLTVFSSSGFFLFASVNPSSWSAAGIGIGWLSLFASMESRDVRVTRRIALAATGIIGFVMAASSRWDSLPMILIVVTIGASSLGWKLRPKLRWKLLFLATAVFLGIVTLLERFSPFPPLRSFRTLYTYTDSQPDNLLFFSYNLTQALPNSLRALGTVPSLSLIVIPKLVYVAGLVLLFITMSQTTSRTPGWQIAGATGAVVSMAVLIMAQVANNDQRDLGSVEPRYVYPLLLFGVGWWFLQGPEESLVYLRQRLKHLSTAAILLYAASIATITERFVDHQSFGIRMISEGPDQWWWSFLPLGPNIAAALSILCISFFFSQLNSSACSSS